MYYDNYDYVADNYDAIMAEDCHVQEIKNELEYYEKLLANGDTTHLTLDEIKANIKRIKKILGEQSLRANCHKGYVHMVVVLRIP